jgi:transcriptional regulator with XRE-family HTH domain
MPKNNLKKSKKVFLQPLVASFQPKMYRLPHEKKYTSSNELQKRSNLMNNISETIKALRRKNDMSQEQLAESLFVSRQAISKWERGEAMPDIENLASLSELFGVTVDDLITGTNILESAGTSTKTSYMEDESIQERKIKFKHLRTKADTLMIIAIMLYIISPFLFILFSYHNFIFAVFGLVIATATGLIIYSGSIRTEYKDLVGITNENQDEYNSPFANKVSSIVSILATITFLILGFFYGLWHPGWIVFLLVPLSRAIIVAFEKDEE